MPLAQITLSSSHRWSSQRLTFGPSTDSEFIFPAPQQRQRRVDDSLIARAAAQISRQSPAHFGFRRLPAGAFAYEFGQDHQHAGRTITTLQTVVNAERRLRGTER